MAVVTEIPHRSIELGDLRRAIHRFVEDVARRSVAGVHRVTARDGDVDRTEGCDSIVAFTEP